MVVPQSASAGNPRSSRGGLGAVRAESGIAVGVAAALVSLAFGVLALVEPAGLGTSLTWTAWVVAVGFGGLAALAGILRAERGRERSLRTWLGVAYGLGAGWALATALLRVGGYTAAGTPADVLLAGSVAAGLLPFVRLLTRLSAADRIALVLDAGCVFLAIITAGAASMALVTGVRGLPLWVSVYPIASMLVVAFATMMILATQTRFAVRGLGVVFAGVVLLAAAVFAWTCQWLADPGSTALPPALFAPAAPLVGAGIASVGREFASESPMMRRRAWHIDAIPLAAVGLIALLMLAESAGAFALPMLRVATVLVVALAIAREAILLNARTNLVRRLLEADERTQAALRRAAAAEEQALGRAAQLTSVLEASGQMRLTSDDATDCERVLDALTPSGATSFLALVSDPAMGPEITAISGPLAPTIATLTAPFHEERAVMDGGSHVRYFSAAGQVRPGAVLPREPLERALPGLRSALAVDLLDHERNRVGVLHLLDPLGERILEPTQIGLAQLAAAQIAAAVENRILFNRLQQELDEVHRVQRELVQATKLGAVAELAAAVAHEVNNPLTGILGFAELLLGELPAGDPRRDEVAVIRSEAVRAREIIRALLELARPRVPQRVPADLNRLAQASLDLLRYRLDEAGIGVVEDYGEVANVRADPDGIRQVLLNLVTNAIDAMPGGGELRLSTWNDGGHVALSVADNGIGMSDETRQKIFTPFFTMRPGSAGRVAGGGLGLAVSLQIVESHGGTIEVESRVGAGSTFTIELPADDTGSASPADVAGGEIEQPDERPLVALGTLVSVGTGGANPTDDTRSGAALGGTAGAPRTTPANSRHTEAAT